VKKLVLVVLAAAAASSAGAASYVEQATFTVTASVVAGLDRDSVGNLYALLLAPGATNYTVAGYRTPALEPLFSFDTGVRAPLAFAVEPSGVVDVLEGGQGITLKRFLNTGYFLGQSTYSLGPYISSSSLMSAAIDRVGARLLLSFQNQKSYYCVQQVGVDCPPSGLKGYINAYDFAGGFLSQVELPGISASPASCFTPTKIAVGLQHELVAADAACQQVLRFSGDGALENQTPASRFGGLASPRNIWLDGDSALYVSQLVCTSGSCPQGVVKVTSDGTLQATVFADSAIGSSWDNRILYLSFAGRSPLRRLVLNDAPTAPVPSGPLGLVVQHSSAASLGWQASSDNEGDPVLYTLELGTSPFVLRSTGTSETADFLTGPLSFGTTYYWRVTARDSYLGLPLQSRASSVENFVLARTNVPPGPFSVTKGTGTVVTRNSSVLLSWTQAIDPDGDVPVYEVSWRRQDEALPAIMTTTAAALTINGLSFGSTYYWSVRAHDDYQAESFMTGGVQTFTAIFLSEAPDPLRLSAPFMASPTIKTMRDGVEVSWERVTNPQGDPISYTAYLGGSPLELNAVARVEQAAGTGTAALRAVALAIRPQAEVQEDGNTVRLRLTSLDYYRNYYFKVTAENPYGSASETPLQNFTLASADSFPRAYNYPNPFSPGRGGTSVVFNAPASGYSRAVLTVYSEFGQKLYERDCGRVPPGISEVRFDGRDQHGQALQNGSYVVRVRFDGPSETATFFLLVVK
jgi:hypothetical protein